MAISFAGIELLLEDQDGELMKFLDHYLPVEDLRIWSKAQVFNNTRSCRIGSIALPNYPQDSRIKLNTLYWPTGATRWAYIHCLASDSIKEAILDDLNGENEPRILSITDDMSRPIQTSMYMLPPRPLTCVELTADATGENAWLLTFVDERYFWQFKTVGDLDFNKSSTWKSVITTIANNADLTIDFEDIDPDYQKPNICLLGNKYANLAAVLDAIAFSVGRRFIRGTDESLRLLEWENEDPKKDTSETRRKDNLDLTWYQTAGDQFSDEHARSVIPEKISILFKTEEEHGVEVKDRTAEDFGDSSLGDTADTVAVVRSTALYQETDNGASITQKYDDLADIIATDYFRSLNKRYDRTFAGVMKWAPTGWDDAIEWSLGRRRPDGSREIQTRVRSAPYNLTIEEMYHRIVTDQPCDGEKSMKLAKTLGCSMTVAMTVIGNGSTNCKQTITLTGSPTAGTWTLLYAGEETSDLQFNASASDIQSALENLPLPGAPLSSRQNIGPGNFTVTGGPIHTTPVAVTFTGSLGHMPQDLMYPRYGKLSDGIQTHDKGATRDVALITGEIGAESPTGDVVKAYNRFRNLGPAQQCIIDRPGKIHEIIQAECV